MSQEHPPEIDKVFKALGHVTRRRILQLLAQSPSGRYPYELGKILDLNRRVVLKHLEALEEAGLVEHEAGSGDMGPDRVYYRVNISFGLSTAVLPNSFFVSVARLGELSVGAPSGFSIPGIGADVRAVRNLLAELEKVNKRLEELDQERMQLVSLRGQVMGRIEDIMRECSWDQKDCERVRKLLDPVTSGFWQDTPDGLSLWSKTVDEIISVFERMLDEDTDR